MPGYRSIESHHESRSRDFSLYGLSLIVLGHNGDLLVFNLSAKVTLLVDRFDA